MSADNNIMSSNTLSLPLQSNEEVNRVFPLINKSYFSASSNNIKSSYNIDDKPSFKIVDCESTNTMDDFKANYVKK